jgi:hypothetical protein
MKIVLLLFARMPSPIFTGLANAELMLPTSLRPDISIPTTG